MAKSSVTPDQLMVVEASRHIHDGDIVNVGMRLPLLAFALAKATHAPHAKGFFDAGIVRANPVDGPFITMCDASNVDGSLWITEMIDLMHFMQQGRVDVGFLGGAEVDRFGNLNTSYIGTPSRPRVKLPGSGGASDIALLSRRTVILMAHHKGRLVENVSYITSLGYGRDGHERDRLKLSGGPEVLITNRATFAFDPDSHHAVLRSIHPGYTLEEIQRNTGWELVTKGKPVSTPNPSEEETAALAKLDPQGFWTGSGL
ncbi:MAG: CoA-transferase [Firmicutes bacterium]|jgi:glutaconate CoA-transferase subunit B|uniref:CoA-transferase n=1 Tax=Sulfobacillus benefaciens TaxID=453960 RepID=A0A2T2WS43_9FIRM|nr:CoA-transferase [Bacillota bacterium]MCL5013013.1 CoA-transferase [Bacillota bacterium]PSR25057.1 MAG: CoA-transferase [Sulfobacillus benefaciens]